MKKAVFQVRVEGLRVRVNPKGEREAAVDMDMYADV